MANEWKRIRSFLFLVAAIVGCSLFALRMITCSPPGEFPITYQCGEQGGESDE